MARTPSSRRPPAIQHPGRPASSRPVAQPHPAPWRRIRAAALLLLAAALVWPAAGVQAQAPEDDPALNEPPGMALRLSAGFSATLDTTRVGEHRLTFTKLEGVLLNSAADPLLHEAMLACAMADDDGFVSGYCTATDTEGDELRLMVQHAGGPEMDDPADGEMLVLGGTGKFANAGGAAGYMLEYEPITSEVEATGRMAIDGRIELAR